MLRLVSGIMPGIAVLVGLLALVLGADRFVAGARDLALRLGMSPGEACPTTCVCCISN